MTSTSHRENSPSALSSQYESSSRHPNDPQEEGDEVNSTTTSTTGSTIAMVKLPKGTMAHRYKIVTYIGVLVTLFLIGSILFAISIAAITKTTTSSDTSSTKNTYNGKEIDILQKREMYRYYSNLIATELSVRTVLRTEREIHQQLLSLPTSPEYQALQWFFIHNDDFIIPTLFNLISNTTTISTTTLEALVQRFAMTALYLHFQLYPYMSPKDHECDWEGVTCNDKEDETNDRAGTGTDAEITHRIITGINITSVVSFIPASGQSVGNETSTGSMNTNNAVEMTPTILGTTIPVSLCYVSSQLTVIDLSQLDLVGTIPIECYLSNMWDNLQEIHVQRNQLQQFFTLPTMASSGSAGGGATLSSLRYNKTVWWPNVRSIHVGGNLLKESIISGTATNNTSTFTSTSILHWNHLQYLNVQGNQNLYGKLFETNCLSLNIWPNIEVLDITETSITGTIPDLYHDTTNDSDTNRSSTSNSTNSNSTGMLSKLKIFAAYRVPLSGSIPNGLGHYATNLEILALGLSDNVWTGTLPESYGKLSALKQLSLSYLNGITGTLPESWGYGMTNLESLDLFGNPRLSGSIPDSWGNMVSLATLRLAQTNINGTIPSTLGQLTRLVDASFHRTNLHGSVPTEICRLRKEYVLTKLSADCIADTLVSNNNEQVPPVSCSKPDCCTSCT